MQPARSPLPKSVPWVQLSVLACCVYGLLLILLIHTTADGSWFWYAQALQHGQHLYRDLHMPLQPVLPLELEGLQRLFGTSWLGQQSAGVLNLFVFVSALLLTTRHMHLAPWQRALALTCAFVTCMSFIMMRFDDFHVIASSLELLCAVLLLRYAKQPTLLLLAGVGALAGLCILTRINDGVLLFAAVFFIAFALGKTARARIQAVVVVPATAMIVILCTLLCAGESFHAWWFYSIHTAAAIKGGSSNLLLYPLRLPVGTLHEITHDWRAVALTAYMLFVGALAAWAGRNRRHISRGLGAALIVIAVLPLVPLWRNFIRGNAGRTLVAFAVFAIYVFAVVLLVRLGNALRGKPAKTWRGTELLMLLPLAQLVSISLSAARWYPNTNPPAALFLILLPVAMPWVLASIEARAVFFTWLALMTFSASVDKLRNPFDWFNYRVGSFDAPRTWFHHPAYGPMLLETSQLQLMQPVCNAVDRSPADQRELLSLPFSYANYFCHVAPWHGYTQTFYDTSSRQTIETLEQDLSTAPPHWIVYQRQLDVLSRNEEAFNNGKPLPHRGLDTFITQQIRSGRWTAVTLPAPKADTSTWLLIDTRR